MPSSTYTNVQAAQALPTSAGNLRKWCGLLESAGYKVVKNEHGYRQFTDADLEVLRFMQRLVVEQHLSPQQAAEKTAVHFAASGTESFPMQSTDTDELLETKEWGARLQTFTVRAEMITDKLDLHQEAIWAGIEALRQLFEEHMARNEAQNQAILAFLENRLQEGSEQSLVEVAPTQESSGEPPQHKEFPPSRRRRLWPRIH